MGFLLLVMVSLAAELVSNDQPILVRYQGQFYTPMWAEYPETTFGGDFPTPTDYLDPFIRQQLAQPGNWAIYAPNRYGPKALNYFAKEPNPAAPSADNWLGTDDRGRDLLAQLLYGFRVSVLFALALTASGVLLGVLTGAIQGYFGGKTDLAFQRFIEIWGSMPELYLLIIFSAVLEPSVTLLLVLLSLFGWMGLSDYVRAEFLRNRQMDYVRAARAMGVGHWQIITRHILPNSLTPVVTFLPFRMSAAILALTSLDFLGLGVPPGTPSLGELLSQGKNNIDAWWISLSTFAVLVVTLLLLTFMGDALRDALDPRKTDHSPSESEASHEAAATTTALEATSSPASNPSLLDVHHLSIAFGAKPVVKGVSLSLKAGQRLALVGESGSGKTITAMALMGLLADAKVTGHFSLNQRPLQTLTEREWESIRGKDLAMVFQEPMTALNPVHRVGQQISDVLLRHRELTPAESEVEVHALLQSVGLVDVANVADAEASSRRYGNAYPHQLSGGQRQRVLIAMALAGRPKVLFADEPTTALDATLRTQILDVLAAHQQASGMALVLISHDLQLVRSYADHVVVMQNGVVVEHGDTEALFHAPQHPYTRDLLNSAPTRNLTEIPDLEPPTVLSASNLEVQFPVPTPGIQGWWQQRHRMVLHGINFQLQKGQTLAVVGESGSGKTTLALAAMQLVASTGSVTVMGREWSKQPDENRKQRQLVQVVFQDPFGSLSPRLTVEELVAEGLRVHEPHLTPIQRRLRVLNTLTAVGLRASAATETSDTDLLTRYPHQFSGGQRQRLAVARALVVNPAVLVLDEPTSALDVTVQKQVLGMLQQLQQTMGLSYLLITHDMAVVNAMAHRVLVLKDGQTMEYGAWSQVSKQPAHPYTKQLLEAAGFATI